LPTWRSHPNRQRADVTPKLTLLSIASADVRQRGVVSLLQAAGSDVVRQVTDGHAAVKAALRLQPDLLLLDIAMPRMSGLEALRLIIPKLPETRVLMLTLSDDDADLLEAIRCGAAGYLRKNLTADEFCETLDGLQRARRP
jgi:DNA-binding NarL/FixJ family response regulator